MRSARQADIGSLAEQRPAALAKPSAICFSETSRPHTSSVTPPASRSSSSTESAQAKLELAAASCGSLGWGLAGAGEQTESTGAYAGCPVRPAPQSVQRGAIGSASWREHPPTAHSWRLRRIDHRKARFLGGAAPVVEDPDQVLVRAALRSAIPGATGAAAACRGKSVSRRERMRLSPLLRGPMYEHVALLAPATDPDARLRRRSPRRSPSRGRATTLANVRQPRQELSGRSPMASG